MGKCGFFITLEGTDGVGKSTQIRLLQSWLTQKKIKVRMTREPGGGEVAENIRRVLLDPKTKMDSLTELYLYEAARAHHMGEVVMPALQRGETVLCDRFTDATVAYQGFGRGLDVAQIETLNDLATGGVHPDLTILLDLPAGKGLKKAHKVKGSMDRLEMEGASFQKKVRKGYQAQARKYPVRIKMIPVQSSIEATQERIRAVVQKKLWKS